MKRFAEMFLFSAREFKNLRSIILTALLIALELVLDCVSFYITPEMRVSFGFLAVGMTGMLCGPVMALTAGAMGDIISYMLAPQGGYFPGFTLSALLCGLLYGLFFYRQDIKLWKPFAVSFIIAFFVNICLNSLWLSILGGKAFFVLLPGRMLKNLALFPIEGLLLYVTAKAVTKAMKMTGWKR